MIEKTEAARLAAAINALRPEWPAQSLLTFISKNLGQRAYRDAAVALTWVAVDPQSVTPARVLEAGPWWKATQAQDGTVSAVTHRCPEHPANAAWNCTDCQAEAVDHERAKELAAQVKAAIPRRTPIHKHPEPPATDVRAAREAIDAKDTP